MSDIKRGDLVLIFDPVRPDGSGLGTRGLYVIGSVDEAEVIAHPVERLHQRVRLPRTAVHATWAASSVAGGFLK